MQPCRRCTRERTSPSRRTSSPAVPGGADPPRGLDRSVDRHPGRDAGRLPALAALPAAARGASREGAPDHGAHLLQVRRRLAGGEPQAEHRDRAGHYNKEAGTKRLATETGAGQWGSALAMASKFFGLDCQVFMVKASYEQKPYRRIFMETFGAEVVPSPSPTTQAGRRSSKPTGLDGPRDRDQRGRRGRRHLRRRDQVRARLRPEPRAVAPDRELEAKAQMELAGDRPDVVIGCVGGGSNYAGLAYPFMADRLSGATPEIRFLATEPAACPTLTKGRFAYDFGDTGEMIPLVPMYTLGHTFVPAPVHAGTPLPRRLRRRSRCSSSTGTWRPSPTPRTRCSTRPCSSRTRRGSCRPRSRLTRCGGDRRGDAARDAGEERVILFGLSGHGAFDMQAYDDYLNGRLPEVEYREEDVAASMASVPDVPIPGVRRALDLRLERPRRQAELLEASFDLSGDERVTDRVEVETVALPDQRHAAALAEVGRVAAAGIAEPVPRVEVDDVTGDARGELDEVVLTSECCGTGRPRRSAGRPTRPSLRATWRCASTAGPGPGTRRAIPRSRSAPPGCRARPGAIDGRSPRASRSRGRDRTADDPAHRERPVEVVRASEAGRDAAWPETVTEPRRNTRSAKEGRRRASRRRSRRGAPPASGRGSVRSRRHLPPRRPPPGRPAAPPGCPRAGTNAPSDLPASSPTARSTIAASSSRPIQSLTAAIGGDRERQRAPGSTATRPLRVSASVRTGASTRERRGGRRAPDRPASAGGRRGRWRGSGSRRRRPRRAPATHSRARPLSELEVDEGCHAGGPRITITSSASARTIPSGAASAGKGPLGATTSLGASTAARASRGS